MVEPARLLLDALAPRQCAGCRVASPDVLCEPCLELALALPLPPAERWRWGQTWSAFPFQTPIRGLVHAAKYQGRRPAARVLAALTAERLVTQGLPPPAAVVPVALARRRRRARGYNQVEPGARALAALAAAPLLDGLRRVRETAPQVGRSLPDRRRNVAGAFAWSGPPLTGTVWLVDDVVTTGATLEAAATVLQRAGAGRIDAVATARAWRGRG
ncbi:MAG: ComF family protein [Chloroflexi bacterium]|nr:MAG: ComF family protein [Chloroflexota bacterium]